MFTDEQAGFWEIKPIISRNNRDLECYSHKMKLQMQMQKVDWTAHTTEIDKSDSYLRMNCLALEEVDSSSLLGFQKNSGFSSFLFYHLVLER